MSTNLMPSEEPRQHAVFRLLLQAMCRPGCVQRLPTAPDEDPLTTLLDSLFDQEVSYCLAAPDEVLDTAIRARWNARPVAAAEADFFIAGQGRSFGHLEQLRRGIPENPDLGATAIYRVASFARDGETRTLTGPGIRAETRISIHGLGPAELTTLRRINSEFPLGLDAVFVSTSGELLSIPRSTRIGD